jgi:hypothetical protein
MSCHVMSCHVTHVMPWQDLQRCVHSIQVHPQGLEGELFVHITGATSAFQLGVMEELEDHPTAPGVALQVE